VIVEKVGDSKETYAFSSLQGISTLNHRLDPAPNRRSDLALLALS